jgi:hypothetical protein
MVQKYVVVMKDVDKYIIESLKEEARLGLARWCKRD